MFFLMAQSHPKAESHTWPRTLSLELVKRLGALQPTPVWLVTERLISPKGSENKDHKRWFSRSCLAAKYFEKRKGGAYERA